MLYNQTFEQLKEMRLMDMVHAIQNQMDDPEMQKLCCEERIALIVEEVSCKRKDNTRKRRERQANLKVNACIEDIKYDVARGLDRQTMEYLSTCQYINRGLNVIITGPTGVGKTWLSCALAQKAIRQDKTAYSTRLANLFEDIQIAQGDGSIRKLRNKLAKYDLLIIDDWAMAPMSARSRHELLELVDLRMESGSIIITSQLPVEKWHDYLGEQTIADAILDRIVQRAYRIELKGDTMRKVDLPNIDGKEAV